MAPKWDLYYDEDWLSEKTGNKKKSKEEKTTKNTVKPHWDLYYEPEWVSEKTGYSNVSKGMEKRAQRWSEFVDSQINKPQSTLDILMGSNKQSKPSIADAIRDKRFNKPEESKSTETEKKVKKSKPPVSKKKPKKIIMNEGTYAKLKKLINSISSSDKVEEGIRNEIKKAFAEIDMQNNIQGFAEELENKTKEKDYTVSKSNIDKMDTGELLRRAKTKEYLKEYVNRKRQKGKLDELDV